jgi:hypothetical protein
MKSTSLVNLKLLSLALSTCLIVGMPFEEDKQRVVFFKKLLKDSF